MAMRLCPRRLLRRRRTRQDNTSNETMKHTYTQKALERKFVMDVSTKNTDDGGYCDAIEFITESNFSISAKTLDGEGTMKEGDQLISKREHHDAFKLRILGDNIVTFESVTAPGLYIGLGPRVGNHFFEVLNPFSAILVNEKSYDKHKLRIIPAKNGSRLPYLSFEPISQPGFVLFAHHDGNILFCPDNDWLYYEDSSWILRRVMTLEEKACRLPPVFVSSHVNSSDDEAAQECPCCLESWGPNRTQVMTECGHSYCMECITSICKESNSSRSNNVGTCAICRSQIRITRLRRVVQIFTQDIVGENNLQDNDIERMEEHGWKQLQKKLSSLVPILSSHNR